MRTLTEGSSTDPWRSWLRVLVPTWCPGCGAAGEVVCRRCRDRVLRGPVRRRPLVDGTLAVASAPWRGPARGLVVAAKEQGRRDVTEVLGRAVARGVAVVGFDPDRIGSLLLVPPPTTAAALLRRRRRPATELAGTAAALLRASGADVAAADLLRHTRRVRDQAGLDRSQRSENVHGAFAVRPGHRRGDVVVVDDVLTTGSTVLEAASALRAAGFRVVGAAVVATA